MVPVEYRFEIVEDSFNINKNFKPLEVKNIKHYWIIDSKVDF